MRRLKVLESKYLLYRVILLGLVFIAGLLILSFISRWFNVYVSLLMHALYLAGSFYVARFYLWNPFTEMRRVLEMTADGYTIRDIYSMNYYYDPDMEKAFLRFKEIIDTKEIIDANRRQAQYLALQNQINPHFLYNTLESIRGEALIAGVDQVAEMTEALASFYRYTISNLDQVVTIENELDNIENYFSIQKFRFGDKLNLHIEMDEDDRELLSTYTLPKLLLQPIVENAIFHGIERKVGRGQLDISITITDMRIIILISDNGLGIEPQTLSTIRSRLNVQSIDYIEQDVKRGGIALLNVNNRIRLLYGEEYGVAIYSTVNVGTNVEITLPKRMPKSLYD